MPRYHIEKILPYTPDQLFALVGNVDAYPEFVPWIQSMRTERMAGRDFGQDEGQAGGNEQKLPDDQEPLREDAKILNSVAVVEAE